MPQGCDPPGTKILTTVLTGISLHRGLLGLVVEEPH